MSRLCKTDGGAAQVCANKVNLIDEDMTVISSDSEDGDNPVGSSYTVLKKRDVPNDDEAVRQSMTRAVEGSLKMESGRDAVESTEDMSNFQTATETLTCNGALSTSLNCFKWSQDALLGRPVATNAVSVTGKFRDLPPRASALTLPFKKNKKRSMSRVLEAEKSPNKMRKSNSENKRPPALQSNPQKFQRRNHFQNGVVLREITGNVKELAKMEKIGTALNGGNVVDVIPDILSSAILSNIIPANHLSTISFYKESNSSLKVKEYKLSQRMIQFYLLGRNFSHLSEMSSVNSKGATVVVITSMLMSPFTSCLVVADRTCSVRLNLTGQAAKFWHNRLNIGQVLLLTRLGVIMDGQAVRLMQVGSREGVKVVGMAGDLEELSTEQGWDLMKVWTKGTSVKNRVEDDVSTERSEANTAFGGDKTVLKDAESVKRAEDEERIETSTDFDGEKIALSLDNMAAKNAVLADSDEDMEEGDANTDLRGGKPALYLVNIAVKKAVLADSDKDMEKGEARADLEKIVKKVEKIIENVSRSLANQAAKEAVLADSDEDMEMETGVNHDKLFEINAIEVTKEGEIFMDVKEKTVEELVKRSASDNETDHADNYDEMERESTNKDSALVDEVIEDNQSSNPFAELGNDSISSNDSMISSETVSTREVDRLCNLGNLAWRREDKSGEKKQKPAKLETEKLKLKTAKMSIMNSSDSGTDDGSQDEETDQEMDSNEEARKWFSDKHAKSGNQSTVDESDIEDEMSSEDSSDDTTVDTGNDESLRKDGIDKDVIESNESINSSDSESRHIKRKKKTRRTPHLLRFNLSESEDEERLDNLSRTSSSRKRKRGSLSRQSSPGSVLATSRSNSLNAAWKVGNGLNQHETTTDSSENDCNCPSCREGSKDMVKFTQRELASVSCKAVRNVQTSPSTSPPQLDTYLDNVDVSFDELENLSHSDSEQEQVQSSQPVINQERISALAALLKQKTQNGKKTGPGKTALDELWLGRQKNVFVKEKPGAGKMEDGQNKEMAATNATPADNEHIDEDFGDDEEEYGVKETYIEYSPVYLNYGMTHPDTVVESSSLASVSPPVITRNLNLPQHVIDDGKLSNVQLESVTYASQMHEVVMPNNTRAGYLIGDGAGVGKGRTIAGIILENWACGRERSVWISASHDLMYDAARDLEDIGVEDISVRSLTNFDYDKQIDGDGVIYSTFAGLVGTTRVKTKRYQSRLDQLQEWLGKDGQFEGPIVFDECHKAKNLVPPKGGKPTKTGLAVLELQNKNPLARVVYASATGASEPKNMAYMVRLGMWGQEINFKDFQEFSHALEKRGTGGLEQVALDLKLRGNYIARQLSFKGVEFAIEEVPLSLEFVEVYDQSVEVWRKLHVLVYDQCDRYPVAGRGDPRKRNFWGFMQKFFKYMAISSKISHVVGLARKELDAGNCVVIGLQSTGEAATEEEMINKTKDKIKAAEMKDVLDDSDTDLSENELIPEKTNQFSSAASKLVRSVITRLVPCQHKEAGSSCDPAGCGEKQAVWEIVMELLPRLPTSSLDQLIDELGGPRKVAELTGRKKRLEKGCDGVYSYVKRLTETGSSSNVNMAEKKLFMSGKKKVAIISEAGSTGISLQADKRVKNQRRRVHITIELPWSADSAIQQFGRTHRSNQSSAPKYVFIISALHGEKRFASIVAKRLESLGALTHGDRRSTRTSDLSTFNFHTDHATYALKNLIIAITEGDNIPMPKPPPEWKNKQLFYSWLDEKMVESGIISKRDVNEEKYPSMTKFMNRLLCVKVKDQNIIFSYFSATLDRVIAQAKKEGRYDTGIVDVVGQEKATRVEQNSFEVKHATGVTTTKVTKFLIARGMSFEEAAQKSEDLRHKTEGFWLSQRGGRKLAVLVIAIPDAGPYRYWKYLIYRPNTGKVFSTMPYEDLRQKYRKVTSEVARRFWDKQYELSMNLCFHAFKSKNNTCKIIREGGECEEGRRRKNCHVISGSLLAVWPQIEAALGSCTVRKERKIQMVRINNEEERIIGINIPNEVAPQLIMDLAGLNAGEKEDIDNVEMNE